MAFIHKGKKEERKKLHVLEVEVNVEVKEED